MAVLHLLLIVCIWFCELAYPVESETDSFICRLSADTLTVMHGNETEITNCLKDHNSARRLELKNNGLKYIPPYIEILKNIYFLDLSSNDLKTANFSAVSTICPNLIVVLLDNNDLSTLRRGDLDCMSSVESLSLANNTLSLIENGTFNTNLKRIKYISFLNNSLVTLDTSLVSRVKISPDINILIDASLNYINLLTNSINLTIDEISSETVIGIILLQNNLTTIDLDYYKVLLNVTNPLQVLNLENCGFDVRFNPWICDCAMFPAAKLLEYYRTVIDQYHYLFSITCHTPPSLKGELIREVPDNQFNCSVTEECPNTCFCQETVALNLVSVECGYKYVEFDLPTEVPHFKSINLRINNSNLTRISYRDFLFYTKELDVSGNNISDVQITALEALDGATRLKFERNNFEYLPRGFLKLNFGNGKILTIDGNPFNCDCHALWMKDWILKHKRNIMFLNNILCSKGPGSGQPVIKVPDDQFVCSTNTPFWTTAVLISGGILLLVLLILLAIFALRRDSIKVFLITRFNFLRKCFRVKSGNCKYDIFVPHSCEDDEPVNQIVEKLETDDPPFTVCLGERHFPLGKTITENILNAIVNSRIILLVVSNNFLRSAWCNMEFREAHARFLRERNINMAIVLLEDLDENLLYDELQIYMKYHVYIKYSDLNFWEKLMGFLRSECVVSHQR